MAVKSSHYLKVMAAESECVQSSDLQATIYIILPLHQKIHLKVPPNSNYMQTKDPRVCRRRAESIASILVFRVRTQSK